MLVITKKINFYLEQNNLTAYKLSKLMSVNDNALYGMINGNTPFSENFKKKLIPLMKVTREEFESWILADKYPKEILELALKAKKEHNQEGKLLLTSKIDGLLKSQNLSRTALSKIIKYSQGKLNEMIIGKEPMSKLVINKVASAMTISKDEITSWIVADKYAREVIELAIKHIV